ncbi:response regulator transcription factor [Streptomyces phaeoluteigriseus]|uniref:Sensory transduction protein RegX3 n=1 Tax=Streptomyces phaeoluteigriseus TaxID=114686 RepID=A0ABY4ZGW5_9ACTN|nr:response regulator transcription factor [Streptomyces phaeoluteigriseus]USQ88191.1 response regulator transcription factor [Streptomyces phaeoluteigriseus]
MGVRVLLIEDDQTIAEPLVEGLGHFGLAVRHVRTGTEGLRGPYGDVVLLDLGLPDVDGIDVCRGIRRTSDVPLIILSARGEEADRVLGLELGADDYLAKPFSMRELVARVRAVTRRTQRGAGDTGGTAEAGRAWGAEFDGEAFTGIAAPGPTPASAPVPTSSPSTPVPTFSPFDPVPPPPGATDGATGPLVVDRRTRQVWVGEETVVLTPKEFELLALLTEDPGAVYSRQQILDRVWDPHYEGPTKTLDVHVATLRRKLGNPAWIQTLRGVGFRLAVQTQPPGTRPAYEPPAQPAYQRPAQPAYEPSGYDPMGPGTFPPHEQSAAFR